MIVTVASNRKQVGKTTIAVNNAAIRALAGRSVYLIDIDPNKSSYHWTLKRQSSNVQPPIPACSISGKYLKDTFDKVSSNYNDVVIDTDWRDSKGSQMALEVSDMVIVPVEPGPGSLACLKKMAKRIHAARVNNPALWAIVVLVRARGALPIAEFDAIRNFVGKESSMALAGTVIRDDKSLQNAFDDGLAVFEYKNADRKSVVEMYDLYRAQRRKSTALPSLSRVQKHLGKGVSCGEFI
jgi:chromosome partitioning protein